MSDFGYAIKDVSINEWVAIDMHDYPSPITTPDMAGASIFDSEVDAEEYADAEGDSNWGLYRIEMVATPIRFLNL